MEPRVVARPGQGVLGRALGARGRCPHAGASIEGGDHKQGPGGGGPARPIGEVGVWQHGPGATRGAPSPSRTQPSWLSCQARAFPEPGASTGGTGGRGSPQLSPCFLLNCTQRKKPPLSSCIKDQWKWLVTSKYC